MKLQDWRTEQGKTQQAVADEFNRRCEAEGSSERISQSSVDRWEKGTIPRQENIRRLSRLTDGVVTFADFYDEPPKRSRGRQREART